MINRVEARAHIEGRLQSYLGREAAIHENEEGECLTWLWLVGLIIEMKTMKEQYLIGFMIFVL